MTALGGHIEVESDIDAGSLFRVVLPPADTTQPALPAHDEPAVASKRARILIIDDDAAILRMLSQSCGPDHDVEPTTSATAALRRIARGERFDLILCDLMMPEMSGLTFAEELQRLAPSMLSRFALVTGGAFDNDTNALLEEGRFAVIHKPFRREELLRFVAERLARSSS